MIKSEIVELIAGFEGCRLHAYQDSVGVWTIGYGHTKNVKHGDVITHERARYLLIADLFEFEKGVDSLVRVKLNDNQKGALVSFAFNLGLHSLETSTLLKKLNAGDYIAASNEFLRWNKAGGKALDGLTKRRESERELFLRK
jgi:lysozyme